MNDDYLTEEEQDAQKQIAQFKVQAERAQLFVDWMRTPASVIFLKMLDDQIADAKNAWLSASSRDSAEVVRLQSQVYLKIKQWLASQIMAGKVAQAGLKQFSEEGAVLSNIIRPPERPEVS